MQTIVVSSTSLFLGGPLTVGREFVAALRASERFRRGDLRVIVLCHRRALYTGIPAHANLTFIEKPHARRNWLVRLFYEYVWFGFWSRRREIDLWVSLQDATPNVRARRRAVYCHNPAVFYEGTRDWRGDPRFELFRLLYGWVYRINLKKNDAVIVQQGWVREWFARRYGVGTVVAYPNVATGFSPSRGGLKPTLRSLLYPAYPRSFKNCELLIEAMRALPELELTLTFRGDETRYARKIRRLAEGMTNIRFVGFLSREELEHEYARADALVFPSKLETWGLPLSEFRAYGKPIFAARMPYAREVLNGYARSAFFTSSAELVTLLKAWHRGEDVPYETPAVHVDEPFARNWDELIAILLRLVE